MDNPFVTVEPMMDDTSFIPLDWIVLMTTESSWQMQMRVTTRQVLGLAGLKDLTLSGQFRLLLPSSTRTRNRPTTGGHVTP
jgi:hypothetical protein